MIKNESENSIQEIEFSQKSSSSSEELQQAQLNAIEQSQSDNFLNRNKFSESSEKSALFSIEKAACMKSKQRQDLQKNSAFNLDKKNLYKLQEKTNGLEDLLSSLNKSLDYEREMSNKKEEVINLNSRLNQLYNENQALEEKINKTENTLKIMNDEYNKTLNKTKELEFYNKQLSEEGHSYKLLINDLSNQNHILKLNVERLETENRNLNEITEHLKTVNSQLFAEIHEKNKQLIDFADFKRQIDNLKEGIMDEMSCLREENFKGFIDENEFLKLMKIFIKERLQLKEEVNEKIELVDKMNKLNKCLEIQTKENRVVIEEVSSLKKINDNLNKHNFDLETKVFKLIKETEDRKARENAICSIIQEHSQIKIELDTRDRIVSEILLLISFYEQIRLAYQEKSMNQLNENNILDIQNLLAYRIFKEDLTSLREKSAKTYPNLMEKIKNLFEEPKVMKENFCQNDFISKNDSFTQIEIEEDPINYEEIQKENEKIKKIMEENQIIFQENVKIKVKTLKLYIEKLFGWKLFSDGKMIKLENSPKNLELYFLCENNEITMLNKEEILGFLGKTQLKEIPEIISYFNLL